MKKTIAIVLLIAGCMGSTLLRAASSLSGDTPQEIVIKNRPPQTGAVPRTPVVVPISAMVQGSTVYVAFTDNLGDVDYELENLSTGELVSDQIVGTGVVLIPFSGDSGDYTISFTLSNGVQFYGEFSL